MIRTSLSIVALFGSLILVSKWLHESNASAQPATSPASPAAATSTQPAAPIDAPRPDLPSAGSREPQRTLPTAQYGKRPVRLVSFDFDNNLPSLFNETDEENAGKSEFGSGPPAYSDANDAESGDADDAITPAKPKDAPVELSPELLELRTKLRECLAHYYFHPENVATRSPWGAMHAMIAYGVDSELIVSDKRVNAIGYLCYNGTCQNQRLFSLRGEKLQAAIGPGVQGHPAQFLAMLAQSRVKTDYPIKVDGHDFTVADLIEHEKETCRPASELTFKLIAFTHYLKSDETWKSNDGQDWDIPRLIKEELKQTIHGAACGGTHRMTGFSYAVRKREKRGEPFEGQWLRAKKYVEDYHEYNFNLQNADGSFSSDWFARRADYGDHHRRLQTTGHITEWLAFSLPQDQLTDPRMVKAVNFLTDLLMEHPNERWSIGPLGHGLHALAIYDERVFGGAPGKRAEQLALARKDSKPGEKGVIKPVER
ncbi:MAG TPA: hypothetical protein VFV87_00080 [Pirellulaceae bacterium]|nr:hypothetical protein [Pirellulaceae bacterium]